MLTRRSKWGLLSLVLLFILLGSVGLALAHPNRVNALSVLSSDRSSVSFAQTTAPTTQSTHSFSWTTGRVQFESYGDDPGTPLQSYTYVGSDVPPAGQGNARINLWLFGGQPPSDGRAVEVIVEAFRFSPVIQ